MYTDVKDEGLVLACNTASTSCFELLESYKFGSPEYEIYVSGLAYGIWVSSCDISMVNLEDIRTLINENVISSLN